MISEHPLRLAAADGPVLEARAAVPARARAGVVLCHPHPLYGGDMDNPVVVRAAEVCLQQGVATCRFNFRGVGASTGTHGGGEAEQEDALAAFDHLAGALPPGTAIGLAGYSFGARVVAGVAGSRRRPVESVALIAPPLAMTGHRPFAGLASLDVPILVVAGSMDEYAPRAALDGLGRELPAARLEVIDGANHFFFGKLYPLGEAVARWAAALVARRGRAVEAPTASKPGQPGGSGGAA